MDPRGPLAENAKITINKFIKFANIYTKKTVYIYLYIFELTCDIYDVS